MSWWRVARAGRACFVKHAKEEGIVIARGLRGGRNEGLRTFRVQCISCKTAAAAAAAAAAVRNVSCNRSSSNTRNSDGIIIVLEKRQQRHIGGNSSWNRGNTRQQ